MVNEKSATIFYITDVLSRGFIEVKKKKMFIIALISLIPWREPQPEDGRTTP